MTHQKSGNSVNETYLRNYYANKTFKFKKKNIRKKKNSSTIMNWTKLTSSQFSTYKEPQTKSNKELTEIKINPITNKEF